jgi:hypothetical protein
VKITRFYSRADCAPENAFDYSKDVRASSLDTERSS